MGAEISPCSRAAGELARKGPFAPAARGGRKKSPLPKGVLPSGAPAETRSPSPT